MTRFNNNRLIRPSGAKLSVALIVTASLLGSWAPAARAATIFETAKITLDTQGPSATSADNPLVKLYDANNQFVTQAYVSQAGAFNWSHLTNVSGTPLAFTASPSNSSDFISFCIELTQDISFGHTYQVDAIDLSAAPIPASGPLGSGMGTSAAGYIGQLWAAHFTGIFTGSASTQDANAAAFQLAIWKLEYDAGSMRFDTTNPSHLLQEYNSTTHQWGAIDFGIGHLRAPATDTIVKQAAVWLNALSSNDRTANLVALTGHQYYDSQGHLIQTPFQDQVVETPLFSPPGQNTVPEPSSLMLCAIGGLGMAAARRGRRRGQ